MKKSLSSLALLFLILSSPSFASMLSKHSIALVYAGTGVCPEDCAAASAASARLAGLTPVLVQDGALPDDSTPEQISDFFKEAAVWIEPGGKASQSIAGMTQTLREHLVDFVKNGGGYVGFCAGAFMSTSIIGSTGNAGLGIFPGSTALFDGSYHEKVNWLGRTFNLYFEGGPYLSHLPSTVEIVANYEDQSVAAARSTYGTGRVFVSGPHPEAPGWWSNSGPRSNLNGPNQSIAADMIKWAAKMEQ